MFKNHPSVVKKTETWRCSKEAAEPTTSREASSIAVEQVTQVSNALGIPKNYTPPLEVLKDTSWFHTKERNYNSYESAEKGTGATEVPPSEVRCIWCIPVLELQHKDKNNQPPLTQK